MSRKLNWTQWQHGGTAGRRGEPNEVRSKYTSKRKKVMWVLKILKAEWVYVSYLPFTSQCTSHFLKNSHGQLFETQIENWSLQFRRPDLHINCRFWGRHCSARSVTHGTLIKALDIPGGGWNILFLVSFVGSVPVFRGLQGTIRSGAVGWGTALQAGRFTGSIPDDVTGIFHWHKSSGRAMVLGLTQPLTEMSTRNISWGVKGAGV